MAQSQSPAELPPIEEDSSDELQEAAFTRRRRCCFHFRFPCFRSGESDNWERISTLGREQPESIQLPWWHKGIEAFKKVREWSELAAGPRWKTFIRRLSRTAGRARPTRFHYDALSYSLNFDDGRGENSQLEADQVFRNFPSRYAAISPQNTQ
ncbi:hypothetical protein Salat_2187000 [Sesamum alatum]|uniref:Uncharacterized protein n=1 Tax=Sesamum alatum TaxID=300844 RepID=A0AAE1XTE3_9LAMI|nr:hypothetical protein Salat_2187000 [Sesamum alatum]